MAHARGMGKGAVVPPIPREHAPAVSASARGVLAGAPLASVMHARENGFTPLVLAGDMTVREALGKLAKRELLSAPVLSKDDTHAFRRVDEGTEANSHDLQGQSVFKHFLGFVAVDDLVGALCDVATKRTQLVTPDSITAGPGTPEFWQSALQGQAGFEWLNKPIEDIAFSGDGGLLFRGVTPEYTVLQGVQRGMLHGGPQAKDNSRIVQPCFHRLAVFDAQGVIVDIVSQHDVVRFLHANLHQLGPLGEASLESLGFVTNDVATVGASVPALEAFARVGSMRVTALAVVDEKNGALLSCLSASDLRGIDVTHLEWLAMPVGEYLSIVHGLDYAGYQVPEHTRAYKDLSDPYMLEPSRHAGSATSPEARARDAAARRDRAAALPACMRRAAHDALALLPTDTFADALRLLVKQHVHRVFVKHAVTNRPVGVISCTDVLRVSAGEENMQTGGTIVGGAAASG